MFLRDVGGVWFSNCSQMKCLILHPAGVLADWNQSSSSSSGAFFRCRHELGCAVVPRCVTRTRHHQCRVVLLSAGVWTKQQRRRQVGVAVVEARGGCRSGDGREQSGAVGGARTNRGARETRQRLLGSSRSESNLWQWWKTRMAFCEAGLTLHGGRAEQQQQHVLQLPRSFVRGKRLSELSTWGIGGPAKYFIEVHDDSQLASTLRYCQTHSLRYFIVGKGSNCLFDDRGFDGCVILNSLDFLESNGEGVYRVGSGYAFNRLGVRCSKEGFTGLEFASGIPGTVGGAVFMNASANGQETAQVLKSVEVLTADGEKTIHIQKAISPGYGYRRSPYQTMPGSFAIVAATFELARCSDARQRHRAFLERRRQCQPVTQKTAGCVFRNPSTGSQSAGALIEQAGLKGYSVGQAQVSNIHSNFLVNGGESTAEDVLALIDIVKKKVNEKFGIKLIEEIIFVPYH